MLTRQPFLLRLLSRQTFSFGILTYLAFFFCALRGKTFRLLACESLFLCLLWGQPLLFFLGVSNGLLGALISVISSQKL